MGNSNIVNNALVYAIYKMEGAATTPYQTNYAIADGSGMTYGYLQEDCATNPDARDYLADVLTDSGLSETIAQQVVAAAMTNSKTSAAFNLALQGISPSLSVSVINADLAKQYAVVNQADKNQADFMQGQISNLLAAAARNNKAVGGAGVLSPSNPDPTALAIAAAWGNRTNGLAKMTNYFLNYTGQITLTAVENYVSTQKQFTPIAQGGNGESFSAWMTRINAAVSAVGLSSTTLSTSGTTSLTISSNQVGTAAFQANGSVQVGLSNSFVLTNTLSTNKLQITDSSGNSIGSVAFGDYTSVSLGSDGLHVGIGSSNYLLFGSSLDSPVYYVTATQKVEIASSGANITTTMNPNGTETITATPANTQAWQSETTLLNSNGSVNSSTFTGPSESTTSTFIGNEVTIQNATSSSQFEFDSGVQGNTLTYSQIASQVNITGLTGGGLAALDGGTSGSASPRAGSIDLPVESATGLDINSGVNLGNSGDGTITSVLLNVATGTYSSFSFMPGQPGAVDGGDGYAIVTDGDGNVLARYALGDLTQTTWSATTVTNGSGTVLAGLTLEDQNYDTITWGLNGDISASDGAVLDNGGFASETQVYALDSGGSVTGESTAYNIATLNSGSATPDGAWGILASGTDNGSQYPSNAGPDSTISITGGSGSGFSGTATLTNVQGVELGGTAYGLNIASGGTYEFQSDFNLSNAVNSDIIAEVTGSTNNITFALTYDAPDYWHVNGVNDVATLEEGTTEMYLAGPASAYSYAYSSTTGTLTLTGGTTGTTTIVSEGGTGEITFADGTVYGIGDVQDAINFAVPYGSFTLDGGTQHDYGNNGYSTANFTSGTLIPDDSWDIYQDSNGNVVMDGTDAGYDGVATLTGIATVQIDNGTTGYASYTLLETPKNGGALSVTTSGIIAEAYGKTDAVTLGNYATTYWQVNGINDTATLNSGSTEMYLPGNLSDYSVSYNGATGTTILTDSVSGRTGTLTVNNAASASGELNFADGSVIGLRKIPDDVNFNSAAVNLGSYGTIADWTFTQGANGAVIANGTADGYGTTTLYNAPQIELGGQYYCYVNTNSTVGGATISTTITYNGEVWDGAGTDALQFQQAGTATWMAGKGNDSASLLNGVTDIVLPGASTNYTIAQTAPGTITVKDNTGVEGTKTITIGVGTGQIMFGSGSAVGLGITTDSVNYAGTGYDTYNLTGGLTTTIAPAGHANVAVFASGHAAPDLGWGMQADGSGDVIISGAGSGYSGSALLTNIQRVTFAGTTYALDTTIGAAGATDSALTLGNAPTGTSGTILVDGPGNDALTFNGTGSSYWHTGAGTDTATMSAGTTNVYFSGSSSQYTLAYNGTKVTVIDSQASRDGSKVITATGGTNTLVFAETSLLLSDTGAAETGGSGNDTFTLASASQSINGGAGIDTVVFSSSTAAPTGAWSLTENASGQTIVTGASAGYAGTATLTAVEQLTMASHTYTLTTTPNAGGSTTIATPGSGISGTIVVDGAGADALTFSGTGTSYWHVGAGNNTATLSAGMTEIYFTGASSQYTETFNGTNVLTVKNTATSATETLTLSGGSGELVFASGSNIALGTTSTGDSVEYGGSANDIFTLASQSATINGGGGTDTVVFSSSTVAPTGAWSITENSSGQVVIGATSVGYNGTATLTSIEQLKISGNTYALIATPNAGGSTTIATPGTGIAGTIVVDGSGADALTFSGTGTSYWNVGTGNNTATLSAGTTNIYFTGFSSQYTETFNGNVVMVKNTATSATETLTSSGGTNTLVFSDTSLLLSDTGATETGGAGNDTFTLASASASINGGAGTDTVAFSSSTAAPTSAWSITENSSGQTIVTGASAGYTGTATLTAVEQLTMASHTYALVTTPNAGGSTTIAAPGTGVSGAIVVDGSGADALTFSGTGTSYWHVGTGNNTATLSAGTTEIYFTGASSQYTDTFNGTNALTVKNTATGATETLTLSGGSGELVFASGSSIGLSKSGDATIYGGSTAATLTGTTGADTIYAGSGADTLIGNGGTDIYKIGAGTGTETIQNGVSSSNTAAGNLDFTGSIDAANLWFMHSGDNLVVDVLGTTRQTVMQNWFATGDTYAQTTEIISADSLKLDTALNNLITAMATFSTSNATFNPQTTTDTTLTNSTFYGTLSATDKSSWHS